MRAALDGFRPFKILNIFSGDVSKRWNFKSFHATLDSVKISGERGSLDTKFCARLQKYFLKMEQFFVALNTISFLSYKQILELHLP